MSSELPTSNTLSSKETATNTLDVQSLSTNQPESYALGSPAFLRRYGKTYSRRSNLTPLTQSLKTYGARNNPKPKDLNSSFLSNPERLPVRQDSSVDTAVKIQVQKETGVRKYSLQNVPSKSESANPKVLIRDPGRLLANELTKQEVIKLATQNLDQSSDKMTKKMVLLNNRSGGSQMLTLYVMQNNQAVSTVPSDNKVIIPSEKESFKSHPAPSSTCGNRVSLANQIFPASHLNLIVSESAGKNKNTLVLDSAREKNTCTKSDLIKKTDSNELDPDPKKSASNPQMDPNANSNASIKSNTVKRDITASQVHSLSSQKNSLDIPKPANKLSNINETPDKRDSLKTLTPINKPIVHVSLQRDNTHVKSYPSKKSISGQLVQQPVKSFVKSNKDLNAISLTSNNNNSKEVQGCVKSLQKDFPQSTNDSFGVKTQQNFSSPLKNPTLLNENVAGLVVENAIQATVDIPDESQHKIVNKQVTEEIGSLNDPSVQNKSAISVEKEETQSTTDLSYIMISDQSVQQSPKSILKPKVILVTSPQRGGRIDRESAADVSNSLNYQPVSINFIPTSGNLITSLDKSIHTSLKEIPKDSSLQNSNNHPVSVDKGISPMNNDNPLEVSGSIKLDDTLQKCASNPLKDLSVCNNFPASITNQTVLEEVTTVGSRSSCHSENDELDISESADRTFDKEKKEKPGLVKDSTLLNRNVIHISGGKDDTGKKTSLSDISTLDKLAEWTQKSLSKTCKEDLEPNAIPHSSEGSKGVQTGVKCSQNNQSESGFSKSADNSPNKETNPKSTSIKNLSLISQVNFSVGGDGNMAQTEPSKIMTSDCLVQQPQIEELASDATLLNSNSFKEVQTGVISLPNKSADNSQSEKLYEKYDSSKDSNLPNKNTYPVSTGHNVNQTNKALDIYSCANKPLTKLNKDCFAASKSVDSGICPSLENVKAVKKVEMKKKKNLKEFHKTKSSGPKAETNFMKLKTQTSSQEGSTSSNSGSIFKEKSRQCETTKTSDVVTKDVIKKKMKHKNTKDLKKSTTDLTSLARLSLSSSSTGKDNKTGVKEKDMPSPKKIRKKDKCCDSLKKSKVSEGDSKMKIVKKKVKSSDQSPRTIAEIDEKSEVLALEKLKKYVPILPKVETFKSLAILGDSTKVTPLLSDHSEAMPLLHEKPIHLIAAPNSKMVPSQVIDYVSLLKKTEGFLFTSQLSNKQKPSIVDFESTNDKMPTSSIKKKKKKKKPKSSILLGKKEDDKADLSTEVKKKKPKISKLSKGIDIEKLNLTNDTDMNRPKVSKENSIKKPKMSKLTSDISIKKSKVSNNSDIQKPDLLTDISGDKVKKSKVKKRKSNLSEFSPDSSIKKSKKLKLKKSKISKVSLDEETQYSKLRTDIKTENYKQSVDSTLKKAKSPSKGEKVNFENSILSSESITMETKSNSTTSPNTSITSAHSSSPKSVFNSEYMSLSSSSDTKISACQDSEENVPFKEKITNLENAPDISKDDGMRSANEALPSLDKHVDLSPYNESLPNKCSPLGLTCAKHHKENEDSTVLANTSLSSSYLEDLSKLTCKRLAAAINNQSYSPSSSELNIENKLKELFETSIEKPTPSVPIESNDSFTEENQNENSCQENPKLPCSNNANQSVRPHQIEKTRLPNPQSKKSFQCSFCGKKFRNRGHLIAHTQVHSSKNCSYKCNICLKRFPTKRNLHEHQRFTAKRPNQCLDCDRDEGQRIDDKPGSFKKVDDPISENTKENNVLNYDSENNESNSSCLALDKSNDFLLNDLKPAASSNLETESNDARLSSSISYEKDLELVTSRLIARRDRRENRIRMLQQHLAGETASDVVQDLNCDDKLTKSEVDSKSESRSSTPERKSGTQGCVSDVKSSHISPAIKIDSCQMISENSSSVSKEEMVLKINDSFSLDPKEFPAFGSVGNMQEIQDSKSLELNSIRIDTDMEFSSSELPPPLLSPQNVSPVAHAMLGEENTTFPLKTEEPPFLAKMVSLDSSTEPCRNIFLNDPTLRNSALNSERLAGDLVKEEISEERTDPFGSINAINDESTKNVISSEKSTKNETGKNDVAFDRFSTQEKINPVSNPMSTDEANNSEKGRNKKQQLKDDLNRIDECKERQFQEVRSAAKTELTKIDSERSPQETGSSEFGAKKVSNVACLLGEDKESVCAAENSGFTAKSDVTNPTGKESEILDSSVMSVDQSTNKRVESEESADVMSNATKKKRKVVFMPMSTKNTSISPQWINLGDWTKFVLQGSQNNPSGDVDPNKRSEGGSGQSEKMYLSVRRNSTEAVNKTTCKETKSSESEENPNECVIKKCTCCFCREMNALPSTTSENDSNNHCPYSESTSTEFSGRCKLDIDDPLKGKRDISVSETPAGTTGQSESTNKAGGLAKTVIPDDENAKEKEESEKCDSVIPDSKLEKESSVSEDEQNNSLPSHSIDLGEWTKMIVQSSMKNLSSDAELIKRSEEKKSESKKRTSKTVSKERRSSGSTSKRKLSVENEKAEGDGSSSSSMSSRTASKPEKKPCLDIEKDKALKYENPSSTCSDVTPKLEMEQKDDPLQPKDPSLESVNATSEVKDEEDNGSACNESPKSKDKYGMSKRNLSRLPSEPVRHLPKRNYKKPQKYFCSDFDYSINFNLLKKINPTMISTRSSSTSSPSKSRQVSGESPEKKNSQQVHKNNANCSPSKKVTNATNNKNTISDYKNDNNKNNNDSKDNNIPNLKEESNASPEISSPNKTSPTERTKRKYDMRKRNLQKEMKDQAKMLSREELSKSFLRLRFNKAEGATENENDYDLQQQYHKKKLLKNATVKKHTVIPKTAKIRKGSQSPPKNPNVSHLNPVKLLPANPKPPLSVVTTERKILPAPSPESLANREKLLKNLIDYGSVNFTVTDERGKCPMKKDSEELDVRTEPTQLSKLLSNPLTGTPSLSLPHSMLPLPVLTSSAPSGTQITTLIPVGGMQTVNNLPLQIPVGSNMLPIVNSSPLFVSSLPAPLPENSVQEQKPVLLHILPLPDSNANLNQENGMPLVDSNQNINQVNKDTKDDFAAVQIKKEVTYDDADYGKQPSDGLSGLCISGVRGGVTTHDMIPSDSNAMSSNPMLGSSFKIKEEPSSPLDWSVTRRRPLKCTLVQVDDGLGPSKYIFECCGLSFFKLPELALHLDSSHR